MAAPDRRNSLLQALPPRGVESYFRQVVSAIAVDSPIVVKQTSDGHGKGIFATKAIKQGQLIFKEAPLVAEQSQNSKPGHNTCCHCFRYLGSLNGQASNLLIHHDEWTDLQQLDQVLSKVESGRLKLPFTEGHETVPNIGCGNGCGATYCSMSCLSADWMSHHSLICPNEPPDRDRNSPRNTKKEALQAFNEHSEETNEIFKLALKAIAKVLARADQLLATKYEGQQNAEEKALKEAWRPFAVAWKSPWWKCVATPSDVENEEGFRNQLKSLATDSLEILKAALFDARFPELFDLELYGSIIGMFELNNLALFVPHPLIFCLEDSDHHSAHEEVKLVAFALSRIFEEIQGCEGTAFFSLQSCLNHHCAPNASTSKGHKDIDGQAVVTATRDIAEGEEICISYVDEALSLQERQEALRDYGFLCCCTRCLSEQTAVKL